MSGQKKVTLFVQCIVDSIHPEVGQALVHIFHKLGIETTCPTHQTCCGQPAYNSGYRHPAAIAAKHFIQVFEDSDVIVCPSGSCVNMVRNHYPELLSYEASWRRRAEELAGRVFELTEYLVDGIGVEDLGARFSGKVTYHDSCHLLRGIRVREQPRVLIRNIVGAEFIEMDDSERCCGFGGAFSVKYPEISTAMLADKVKNIVNSGADTVVGCDMGCLMNIQGMLSRMGSEIRTMHVAQLLVSN
jgi:L-lactate dehydrogenase complex protein LldE